MKRTPQGRPIHVCDNCGLEQPWRKGWRWYGSYRDLEDTPDQEGVVKFCSDKCQKEAELLDDVGLMRARKQANAEKEAHQG